MAPISINGNIWDPATSTFPADDQTKRPPPAPVKANDTSATKYILVQGKTRLTQDQLTDLEASGAKLQSYVALNTYLCFYGKVDLKILRSKLYVDNVDIYHPVLKVDPALWPTSQTSAGTSSSVPAAGGTSTGNVNIRMRLHDNATITTERLVQDLAGSGVLSKDRTTSTEERIFTTVSRDKLANLAKIESIRLIEEILVAGDDGNIAQTVVNDPVYHMSPDSQSGLIVRKCEGAGQVIHIVDSGFDKGSTVDVHPAFEGKHIKLYNAGNEETLDDKDGHGTHCAGCAVGNGSTTNMGGSAARGPGRIRGTAPAANLVVTKRYRKTWEDPYKVSFQKLLDVPYTVDGVRISSHSYGPNIAVKSGENTVYKQHGYGDAEDEIDTYAFDKQDLLLCWSAGNDGETDKLKRQIGGFAGSKNVLTVGNSLNTRQLDATKKKFDRTAPTNPNPFEMALSSSRGPTVDNRTKPDLCAPGCVILAPWTRATGQGPPTKKGESDDPIYCFKSGTSMATPIVAGCAAALREALGYQGVVKPSAALLKVLLINGAVDMTGVPVGLQGFGRINMGSTMHMVHSDPNNNIATKSGGFVDAPDATKGMVAVGAKLPTPAIQSFQVSIPTPQEAVPGGDQVGHKLKVTMTWLDLGGKNMKYMLGLAVVASDNQRRHGNQGDIDMSALPPEELVMEYDFVNTVQQVLWQNAPPGVATIIVHCYGANMGSPKPVKYAVAWSIE